MATAMQRSIASARTGAFKAGAAPVRRAATSRRATVVVQAKQSVVGVGLFGTKAGMMSYFTEEGLCVPATVIAVEEGNIVTMVKTEATDGYNAVQTGYRVAPERKVKKPELGHLQKAGCPPMRTLREWRLRDPSVVASFAPGQQLQFTEMFKEGDTIDVAGTSIGKGFQGGIKRHGMKRGLMTHGSKTHREHGSIGAGTTPGRVYPGLKMAGQMGNVRITVKNLPILKVDPSRKALVLKGSVPGKAGTILEMSPAKHVGHNW